MLRAMRERFFEPGAFAAFCEGFTAEMAVQRRKHLAQMAGARRELATVERELRRIIQAIKDGVSAVTIKDELLALEERKAHLSLALAEPSLPAMHPNMAHVFQQKATTLAASLEYDEHRDAARLALRGFLDHIVIPKDGLLQVVGNVGAMLAAAHGRARTANTAVGYVGCGGVQPAVLAAVERGGVSTAEWPELTNCRQRADATPPHRGVARAPPIIPTAMGSSAVSSAGRRRGTPRIRSQTSPQACVLRTRRRRRERRANTARRRR